MDKRKIIEWHPAFEASIQIEFEKIGRAHV